MARPDSDVSIFGHCSAPKAVGRVSTVDCITELEGFARRHRSCGRITGDAGALTAHGYLMWLECSCGGRLERWVTSQDAEEEISLWLTGSMN